MRSSTFLLLFLFLSCKTPLTAVVEKPGGEDPPQVFQFSYVPEAGSWSKFSGEAQEFSASFGTFSFTHTFSYFGRAVDVNNTVACDIRKANTATLSYQILAQNIPTGSYVSSYINSKFLSTRPLTTAIGENLSIPSSMFKSEPIKFGFTFGLRLPSGSNPPKFSVAVTNILLKASE